MILKSIPENGAFPPRSRIFCPDVWGAGNTLGLILPDLKVRSQILRSKSLSSTWSLSVLLVFLWSPPDKVMFQIWRSKKWNKFFCEKQEWVNQFHDFFKEFWKSKVYSTYIWWVIVSIISINNIIILPFLIGSKYSGINSWEFRLAICFARPIAYWITSIEMGTWQISRKKQYFLKIK